VAITPVGLREAFEDLGYRVEKESPYNWLVVRDDKPRPFNIPRLGRYISADVLAAAEAYEPLLSL
jgi:hypothetical protein